jgi:hypothetical protein
LTTPSSRQASTDHWESPDRIAPTLATEPIDRTHAAEATDPTDKIEPADPIDKMEPEDPIDKMEPEDPIDKMEPEEPMLSIEPGEPVERNEESRIRMRAFLQPGSGTATPDAAVHRRIALTRRWR